MLFEKSCFLFLTFDIFLTQNLNRWKSSLSLPSVSSIFLLKSFGGLPGCVFSIHVNAGGRLLIPMPLNWRAIWLSSRRWAVASNLCSKYVSKVMVIKSNIWTRLKAWTRWKMISFKILIPASLMLLVLLPRSKRCFLNASAHSDFLRQNPSKYFSSYGYLDTILLATKFS